MRYHNRRCVAQFHNDLVQLVLRDGVKRSGRFVEDEQTELSSKQTRETELLCFATGENDSVFVKFLCDLCVKSAVEFFEDGLQPELSDDFVQFFVRDLAVQLHVFRKRHCEKVRVLKRYAYVGT